MKDNKVVYHFSSSVCSSKTYNNIIIDDKYKTAQASLKLFRVFCDGFIRNGKTIKVFSKRPTSRVMSGKRFIPSLDENDSGIIYHYCNLFNIPLIGHLYSFIAALLWYLLPTKCNKDDIVFIDPLNISIGYGTLIACKLRGIKNVMILTDLPRYYCYSEDSKMNLQQKLSEKLSRKADAYVFITKQMNDVINTKNKPYMVMEGFVDADLKENDITLSEKYSKFTCMYTGGIEKIYGLDMLVNGFLLAKIPNSELHLYGGGRFLSEINTICKEHENIIYCGVKNNSDVVLAQKKASLLINPRYTNSEFTKYSFPGKNLEYAASGTPTLTTKLPGMPSEYYEYVFILEEETSEALSQMLKNIAEKTPEELYNFGKKTKEWMLSNKNCKTQIMKIIEFTNSLK